MPDLGSRQSTNRAVPSACSATFEPQNFHNTLNKATGRRRAWAASGSRGIDKSRSNAKTRAKQQKSPEKSDAVLGPDLLLWQPASLNDWGGELEPYQRLQYDLSEKEPLRNRVKRWINEIARADGIEIDDDNEDFQGTSVWQGWGNAEDDDWGSIGQNEWQATLEDNWMYPPQEKLGWGVESVDMAAVVSASDTATHSDFVERVAKARGMKEDCARLHAFYKLPTEEKINRIQEIVTCISNHAPPRSQRDLL